ncbi:MAG: OadG family protein [Pseudomonadota bacterium]
MNELLFEGLKLMLLGMGSVFVFLLMLVVSMKLMSMLAQLLESSRGAPAPYPAQQSRLSDPNIVAVITAAVTAYRNRR